MVPSRVDWAPLEQLLQPVRQVVLTSHIRPDCDALGSELAMAALLRRLGKQVKIVNAQATPPNLAFIDPQGQIQVLEEQVPRQQVLQADLLMVLDTSAWAQLGAMGEVIRSFGGTKVVIDHHQSSDDLGAVEFRDTVAEATGRLVFEACRHFGVEPDAAMAQALFAALATDTGWFRFRSTNPGTFQVAAELVQAGAVPQQIYTQLYEQDTLARLQLRGRILARAQTELGGRVIHSAVFTRDFEETGALRTDTEDAINLTLTVAGVQVAVILIELSPGEFKLSLRSRCQVDCSQVAARFGGGGHKAAAGALLRGDYQTLKQQVLDAVAQAMQ